MARTPLLDWMRHAAQVERSARMHGEPLGEHIARLKDAERIARRTFVRRSATAGALLALPTLGSGCGGEKSSGPRVGVVGAGLAGLHCAYRLANAGIDVRVFEAWNRIGGRTFTVKGMFEGDQLCELGGELIDSNHETMKALATEFGLTLDDLNEPAGIRAETFFFDGRVRTEEEIIAAYATVAPALAEAYETAEGDDEAAFEALDAESIPEFLDSIPGADPLIKSVLLVAYEGEYGLPPAEQSILNLVYLIDSSTTDPFRIFGASDERHHLHEGSQAIADTLASRLEGRIETEHRLVAIRKTAGERISLTFSLPGGVTREETFDKVVLTLPFTMLREVEIQEGLFAADKMQTIEELGYGTNAKLMLQFSGRPWRTELMTSGSGFADNGLQSVWETSRGQAGPRGILTHFVGGAAGLNLNGAPNDLATRVLPLIEQVFPGTAATYNGRALRMHWPSAPFHKGSYTCYRPGQWAFFGIEGRREGNVHFAGEHTSEEFQGYMEGAAESGLRAAMEVMSDIGIVPSAELRAARG